MRRDLPLSGLSWLRLFDFAEGEVPPEFLVVVILGEMVNSCDLELSTISQNGLSGMNLVTSQVVVSNLGMAGLTHSEGVRKLPALE